MTSPYLDQPLLPLSLGLSRILVNIEDALRNEAIGPTEKWRLRQRAELMRRLLRHRGQDVNERGMNASDALPST